MLDLMCMYSHYVFHPSLMSDKEVMQYLGMTAHEGMDVYDRFLEAYIGDHPDPNLDDLQKLRSDIVSIHAARFCIIASSNSQIFSSSAVEQARKNLRAN